MANQKKSSFEAFAGTVALILTIVAVAAFLMSYTTNYYVFGQMNSGLITICLACAIALEIANIILHKKYPDKLWTKYLTYGVTALLAYCAIAIVGERVEAIGTTIITDYDAGHGGEEAIYYSLGSVALLLIAMIYNIRGSFESSEKKYGMGRRIAAAAIAAALCVGVTVPVLTLTHVFSFGDNSAANGAAAASAASYQVSYNQTNGNTDADVMPSYQFLCCDLSGFARADSRLYVDVTLDLAADGTYKLQSDSYVIESGKRAVVGDDTGLGLVLKTVAEGTYVRDDDGTVTTSVPTHAAFELQTDTYSAQMKAAAKMNVNGSDTDGVYDSAAEPAVLDFVPETKWTLDGSTIVSWKNANLGGTYTISLNQQNGNTDADVLPNYQFLSNDMSGLLQNESRLYVDISLTLDGEGSYDLFSDCYVIESGKRAVVGDDTGLGLVYTTKAEGSYTENSDGTYTINTPAHAAAEIKTDTYSSQMKSFLTFGDHDEDGVFDSADVPEVLDFVPETIFTLDKDTKAILSWMNPDEAEEAAAEVPTEEASPAAASIGIPSDDGSTEMVFCADGTYVFKFEAYGVEDAGTYTYENGVLTITNAAGVEATAEGDPMKLHYISAVSDQLTGDFTIPADTFGSSAEPAAEPAEGVTVTSDDEATTITFFTDGSYKFEFAAYGVEDLGTYTYENGVLTLTNANGAEATADGDPMKLHYVTAVSDQLTGDYSIAANTFGGSSEPAAEPAEGVTVTSDDEATTITFFTDGSYKFEFAAYGVEDLGTYTYENGVLTLTNANGAEAAAEGDPMHLHYVTAVSDMLSGDYTIEAGVFEGEEVKSVTVVSDDEATTITFFSDGTYQFEFAAYGVEDLGTYTYENGVLTLTNANGAEAAAEGDPMHLHYVTAVSDQLTGDYTIEANTLDFDSTVVFTINSTDEATKLTFNSDGTYVFEFPAYSVSDPGTWSCAGTVVTLTNANGLEMTADIAGDGALHYVSALSDQLAGDFVITLDLF